MTYIPKPGDRVTSPLLVGEWLVLTKEGHGHHWIRGNTGLGSPGDVAVPTATLTPVTPPLPPEPAVGSVVRAHGRLWAHETNPGWFEVGVMARNIDEKLWPDLAAAADLSPVVAVDDVAEWLASPMKAGMRDVPLEHQFRAEFGGWDK